MTAPPGPPRAGALLDARYRVGPAIARGGMSTVHRGTDTRLDRPVAIKLMDPRLAADPAFRTRFEREARSAARIDHPAVVAVHDQGEDHLGGEPVLFLVMELVEGGTLRDVLRAHGALTVPAALAVLEPVLAGLAQAHRLGLVHRDVKPENVLISRSGEVKVADFGLVTAAAQAGASHAGMIMGTPAYLSPEQVTTGAADPRSDVYAAGVLLYELLTGAPPYTGDTAISVAYRHVNSDVPPPSTIAGDVPPELDELVRRATRRDPAARPVDAAAFLDAVARVRLRLAVPRVPPPVPPAAAEELDTMPVGPHRASHATGIATNGTRTFAAGLPSGPGGTRTMPRPGKPSSAIPSAGLPGRADHRQVRRRGRRIFAGWIAVVLVIGLLVAVGAWWLGTGRWTEMPSLVGLEQPAAERLLADADLVSEVVDARHDVIEAGLVAATDPGPDARLRRGSEVLVTVSTGRPMVPAVAPGTAVAAAEEAVRAAELTPVRTADTDEFSDAVRAGGVIRTSPAAGEELAIGAPVTLVVSRGPEPEPEPVAPAPAAPAQVRVPFLIGGQADVAAQVLSRAGLRVRVDARLPFVRGTGLVIGQDPGAGSVVEPGSTVVLSTL